MPSVLAIAAHPDDIEIMMAGTLLMLAKAGWELHYFNLSTGNCGSMEMDSATTARTRLEEAKQAAAYLNAKHYEPIANDLEITYRVELLRKVAAVVRQVKPTVVLTHALADYMEDHMETARLAVTATFAHGAPNFACDPPTAAFYEPVALYHALPHGLHDGQNRPQRPALVVDVANVHAAKLHSLSLHVSQQSWLSSTQGMNSYLATMEETSRQVGAMAGISLGEGWTRHLHLGMSPEPFDPLSDLLSEHVYHI
jgi:N-acetylglucosamine malate deacetylase 1